MILQELFENRLSDIHAAYQDYLRIGKSEKRKEEFTTAWGMTPDTWARRHQDEINKLTAHQRPQPVGDEHLFRGSAVPPVQEGAMSELHAELAEKYRELVPKIEKYKDSFLAGQLYDALEAIAMEHGAEQEFQRMMTGARNRAHMDYDTNPGGFQNWFWYLPFADEQELSEESQDDRNARIIAGEIEDAMSQGNQDKAKQKLKDLLKLGYYLDAQGKLHPMGMYEEVMENLRKWFKEKWVRFGPDGKIRGDCARGSNTEGKPKCLPQSKAHALGKKGRASAAAKKRRQDPNPERRGAAKNVATKEGIFGLNKEQIDETLASLDSDSVRKIQHMLNMKFDANLDVDGEMGPLTVASIKKFLPSVKKSSSPDPSKTTAVQGKESKLDEKQDACYHKVKSRYKVWPSAYASGALVQCRKKGAANWGKGSKKK